MIIVPVGLQVPQGIDVSCRSNAVQKNHPFAVAVLLHPVELLHDQLPPGAGDRPILGGRQLPGGRRGARLHPEVLQYVDGE